MMARASSNSISSVFSLHQVARRGSLLIVQSGSVSDLEAVRQVDDEHRCSSSMHLPAEWYVKPHTWITAVAQRLTDAAKFRVHGIFKLRRVSCLQTFIE